MPHPKTARSISMALKFPSLLLQHRTYIHPTQQSNYSHSFEPAPVPNSLESPISQTSKTPVSAIPFRFSASFSSRGGSMTSSSVSTQVPQWMPIARWHFVSMNMFTLSRGLACIGDMMKRGSYAPMGMRPKSNGPRSLPICLKAGQTGRREYFSP